MRLLFSTCLRADVCDVLPPEGSREGGWPCLLRSRPRSFIALLLTVSLQQLCIGL